MPGATIHLKPSSAIAPVGRKRAHSLSLSILQIALACMIWVTTFTNGASIGTIRSITPGRLGVIP